MADTKINWATTVWNPVTGCSAAGSGCLNCYAKRLWPRLRLMSGKYRDRNFGDVRCHEDVLLDPLKWSRKRRVIFVNSMGDLFHPAVPDAFLDKVFAVMLLTGGFHQFVVLTKRPERMRDYVGTLLDGGRSACSEAEELTGKAISRMIVSRMMTRENRLPGFIALGVSCSTQTEVDRDVPVLLGTRAATTVLSLEPMLGPVDVSRWLPAEMHCSRCSWRGKGTETIEYCIQCGDQAEKCACDYESELASRCPSCGDECFSWTDSAPLSGVIVGGESGPNARPMDQDWVRGVRNQCADAGVPFFFKQYSQANPPEGAKNKNYRILDGVEHNDLPWKKG